MRKSIIILLLIILVSPFHAFSDTFAPVGTSVAQFLEIGVGAGATGMGEAYTVMAKDASAAFWNPAGLADVQKRNLFTSYTQWPAGISVGALSFATNVGNLGTFAVNSIYLMADDMEVTTIDNPEGTGEYFSISNHSLGLSYSRYLTDKVSVGVTTKYVHEGYYDHGYSTWALDLGTVYRTGFHGLKLGMSVLHFAPEINFDGEYIDYSDPKSYAGDEPKPKDFENYSLPINFRFGVAMDVLNTGQHKITAATDMIHPNNNIEQYNAGLQYTFNKIIHLRTGYQMSADEGGFSFGGGTNLQVAGNYRIILNYSYADMGILSGINRFSLNIHF